MILFAFGCAMYDLHCHILPGVDDGPPDWNAALEMARALVAEGVTHVAATPHGPGSAHSHRYDPTHLRGLVVQLREHLQRAKISLQVVLGTEIVFDVGLVHQLQHGQLLPYGSSRAVLLESPSQIVATHLERAIFELQLAGYRVVLAHPERTRAFQDNPNLLVPLVERGVLIQVTAGSLVGLHGERLRQIATQLVCHNLAHLLASDAHTATGHRAPALQAAVAYATILVGQNAVHQMTHILPKSLLSDGPLPLLTPRTIETPKQRWWARK